VTPYDDVTPGARHRPRSISAAAEAWHAFSHLQMDTHAAPIAGSLSFVGFLVVVVAMWLDGRRRHRANDTLDQRRAA